MSVGVVTEWHIEGWGVIESRDTPGGCWAHFSHLWASDRPKARPGDVLTASRSDSPDPVAGEEVDFDWEPAEQDGYSFRATDVRPRRSGPRWVAKRL